MSTRQALEEYHKVIEETTKKIEDPNIDRQCITESIRVAIAAQAKIARIIGLDKHGPSS